VSKRDVQTEDYIKAVPTGIGYKSPPCTTFIGFTTESILPEYFLNVLECVLSTQNSLNFMDLVLVYGKKSDIS